MKWAKIRPATLCAALACAMPGGAGAVGISLMEISVSGMGNGQAGSTAEANDPSVLFYNPAALTRFKKVEQTAAAVFIQANTQFKDSSTGSNGYAPNGVYERDPSYGIAPSNFLVVPVNSRLVVGAGISGSAGLVLRYPNDYPGRFQSKSTDIKVTRLNLALAYKLTPRLSIGANASVERFFQSIRTDIDFVKAASAEPGLNGLFGMVLSNPLIGNAFFTSTGSNRSAPLKLKLYGTATNIQLGTLFELSEQTRFGLSYRPKTTFKLKGKYNFQEAPPPILVSAAPELLADGEMTQEITMPSELRASVYHEFNPKLALMGDITRYDYSSIQNIEYFRSDGSTLKNYVQNLEAGNRYAIGMNYKLLQRLEMRAGLSHDEATSDDRYRVTALPDQARTSLHLGAGVQIDRNKWIDVAFQHSAYRDAQIVDRSDMQGVQGEKSFDGDLNGTVSSSANFLGVQYHARF